jgi:glycosyltransferase involved in cell wall biosynthesis
MKCWIVITDEPLPAVDPAARLLRCGILAQYLVEEGHQVTWWTSTFHHLRKANRFESSRSLELQPGLRLELLHAPAYQRNVSWRRVRYNRHMAGAFASRAAEQSERPDVIFAALPSLELAEQAVHFGRVRGVPVVIDARDKWPDLYLNAIPAPLRGLARPVLTREFARARRIFQGATGITAVSQSYLAWGLDYAGRAQGPLDAVFPLGFRLPDGLTKPEIQRRAEGLRQTRGLRPDALVVTFLGMFGSSYDLATVIEAARRLHFAGEVRIQIVLAGTGDLEPMLQRSALGLPNVVFTGWLDQAEAWSLLSIASLGLCPYTREALQSLPNKPFEYMAAGIPIVSSLTGELALLLQDEHVGRMYRAGDAASLAEVLRWFADHPADRQAMGQRAAALYLRRFTASAIYPKLVRHLRRVAETTSPSASETPGSQPLVPKYAHD